MTAYSPVSTDPTAVVGKRIVAAIIDALIAGVPAFLLTGTANDGEVATNASTQLVALVIGFLNNVVLQGQTGASAGKHALGLRVISEETYGLADFGKCALRWVVSILDVMFCFLIGLIMIATTERHRRLGDMAAKTLVVDKNSVGRSPMSAGGAGPYATPYGQAPYGVSPTPTQAPPPGGWSPPPAGNWAPPTQTSTPSAFDNPAPSTFGAPAQQPPMVQQPQAAAPQPAAQPQQAAAEPQWDAARNTYIVFDQSSNRWMQWNNTTQQWTPIV